MTSENTILLTQKLIRMNTVNSPGNEKEAALFVGAILEEHGFNVSYPVFDKNRLHVIAEKGLSGTQPPVVLSGHLDVVPLGSKAWTVDPFAGEIIDGKIFGRGSSDMKAGVAAIISASIQAFEEGTPEDGVRLIITAGEELGCQGIQQLVSTHKNLGEAAAIIIAEPTANIPVTGHKDGLYLNVSTSGKTAHSSMPHLGDNAIYKAARAISKIENFNFVADNDPLLGYPTINVGKMSGGLNLNSVPDHAEFTIDIRSTTKINHADILQYIKEELGDETKIETLVNMTPASTLEEDPFVQLVYDVCEVDRLSGEYPKALPYLTDGSVLQRHYKGAPTIILGPGQPEMAHQTNEFCFLDKIEESVIIYKNILLKRKYNND